MTELLRTWQNYLNSLNTTRLKIYLRKTLGMTKTPSTLRQKYDMKLFIIIFEILKNKRQ